MQMATSEHLPAVAKMTLSNLPIEITSLLPKWHRRSYTQRPAMRLGLIERRWVWTRALEMLKYANSGLGELRYISLSPYPNKLNSTKERSLESYTVFQIFFNSVCRTVSPFRTIPMISKLVWPCSASSYASNPTTSLPLSCLTTSMASLTI